MIHVSSALYTIQEMLTKLVFDLRKYVWPLATVYR